MCRVRLRKIRRPWLHFLFYIAQLFSAIIDGVRYYLSGVKRGEENGLRYIFVLGHTTMSGMRLKLPCFN